MGDEFLCRSQVVFPQRHLRIEHRNLFQTCHLCRLHKHRRDFLFGHGFARRDDEAGWRRGFPKTRLASCHGGKVVHIRGRRDWCRSHRWQNRHEIGIFFRCGNKGRTSSTTKEVFLVFVIRNHAYSLNTTISWNRGFTRSAAARLRPPRRSRADRFRPIQWAGEFRPATPRPKLSRKPVPKGSPE